MCRQAVLETPRHLQGWSALTYWGSEAAAFCSIPLNGFEHISWSRIRKGYILLNSDQLFLSMNYRHLQFFVSVVERGSIKAAADQLKVSQPAISAAIRNLEGDFGARLLDRRRDGSVPTVYGQALYDSAVTMAKVVDNARLGIAALKDPTRRYLRIGTGPSVSTVHVSLAVSEWSRPIPGSAWTTSPVTVWKPSSED